MFYAAAAVAAVAAAADCDIWLRLLTALWFSVLGARCSTTDPLTPLATLSFFGKNFVDLYFHSSCWLMKFAGAAGAVGRGPGCRVMPMGIKIACAQKYAMDTGHADMSTGRGRVWRLLRNVSAIRIWPRRERETSRVCATL